MPLSAMLARADLMDWKPGAHASTFGGNPVSAAAALATLDLLQSGLVANAARIGAHMIERLNTWPERFANVGDVRGLGLMIGIEIVRDRHTRERSRPLRDEVLQLAFDRGLLVLGAGENSIRLSPPLVVTREQADFAIDVLEDCLRTIGRAAAPQPASIQAA
jgi:4-aminobutyrate aminotransferase